MLSFCTMQSYKVISLFFSWYLGTWRRQSYLKRKKGQKVKGCVIFIYIVPLKFYVFWFHKLKFLNFSQRVNSNSQRTRWTFWAKWLTRQRSWQQWADSDFSFCLQTREENDSKKWKWIVVFVKSQASSAIQVRIFFVVYKWLHNQRPVSGFSRMFETISD